jgi:hypothetical protein
MQLKLDFKIKEIVSGLNESYGIIYIRLKTEHYMRNSFIETLRKFTDLENIAEFNLVKAIIEHKNYIENCIDRSIGLPHRNSLPKLQYATNGKAILLDYYIGNTLNSFEEVIDFVLNQNKEIKDMLKAENILIK